MATKNHEEAIIVRNSSRILVLEKIQIHIEINFDKWQTKLVHVYVICFEWAVTAMFVYNAKFCF